MGFFIPGLGGNPGGGAPGNVTTVNGKTGNVVITAAELGAVTGVTQTADEIKLQSGLVDVGTLTVIGEPAIDNMINNLI